MCVCGLGGRVHRRGSDSSRPWSTNRWIIYYYLWLLFILCPIWSGAHARCWTWSLWTVVVRKMLLKPLVSLMCSPRNNDRSTVVGIAVVSIGYYVYLVLLVDWEVEARLAKDRVGE